VSGDLVLRRADLSRSAPPRWAWVSWLVIGYLNLLIGNEGVGKGTFVCWVLARLTRGELPGDLYGHPINVGILGDEDSFDDVVTPRLHACGADLNRVLQIEGPDGGFVNIAADRERLGQVVLQHQLGALYCDQLLDNLGAGTDDWRQKAVRDALQPLRALARELEVLALGTLHPNKRADSFRSLVSGAAAFNAVSRSSLLLAQHPDDDAVRVLARGKGNLSKTPDAIEFKIVEHRFNANGHEFAVPIATDFTTGALTVEDLLGNEVLRNEHSKIAEACEMIGALLPPDGQWHEAKPIRAACEAEGLDDRTVKRAKARLNLEHRRTSEFQAGTEWRWPTQDTHGSSASDVLTIPTVLSSSKDTQDTQDSENTRANSDPTLTPLADESFEAWEQRVEVAAA
jgi:hypothetical protein